MNAGMKSGLIGGALIASVGLVAFSIYKSNLGSGSNPFNTGYCGKSVNGFTVCIPEADVTCSEIPVSTVFQGEILLTKCRANGTITDLTGNTKHYSDSERQSCKRILPDKSVIYESENEFACLSGKHYGLFQ